MGAGAATDMPDMDRRRLAKLNVGKGHKCIEDEPPSSITAIRSNERRRLEDEPIFSRENISSKCIEDDPPSSTTAIRSNERRRLCMGIDNTGECPHGNNDGTMNWCEECFADHQEKFNYRRRLCMGIDNTGECPHGNNDGTMNWCEECFADH